MNFSNYMAIIDRVAFELGPIKIYWYAVMIIIGILTAIIISLIEGEKIGIEKDTITDILIFGIPIAIIGTRLYYVLFNLDQYDSFLEIISLQNGGLAIHGGIIASMIFGFVFAKRRKLSLPLLVDLAAPAFLIAQAIGRWGNFINQEAHGGSVPGNNIAEQTKYLQDRFIPNFIIEQMNINGVIYHPTFLYESIWNVIGFIIILIIRRTKKILIGEIALFYIVWYSVGRFFIEGLRTDSLMLGNIRVAQLVSILGIVAGVTVFIVRRYLKINKIYYHEVLESKGIENLKKEENDLENSNEENNKNGGL